MLQGWTWYDRPTTYDMACVTVRNNTLYTWHNIGVSISITTVMPHLTTVYKSLDTKYLSEIMYASSFHFKTFLLLGPLFVYLLSRITEAGGGNKNWTDNKVSFPKARLWTVYKNIACRKVKQLTHIGQVLYLSTGKTKFI